MYTEISKSLPPVDALRNLPVRNVALLIVHQLSTYSQSQFLSTFIGDVLIKHYSSTSEIRAEAGKILMEGFEYAVLDGLIARDPGFSAGTEFPYRVTRRGTTFLRHAGSDRPWRDVAIRELIHPAIEADAMLELERGPDHYADAIFKAFRVVEIAVRDASELPASIVGMKLMHKAFDPGGALDNDNEDAGEQAALAQMFAGAIGVFKNPASHREATSDANTAMRALVFASELLYMLDEILYLRDEQAAIKTYGP